MKRNSQYSSIPARIKPVRVWNVETGEELDWEHLQQSIALLTGWVKRETERLWAENKTRLAEELTQYKGRPQPSEWARQHSYNYDPNTLPQGVKVKYRINKLVQHKLITEASSYILNPNPNKQEHSFSPAINLGAVDKQMCSIGWDGEHNTLTLEWKCWETHYLLEFHTPTYVTQKRVLQKWCLPTVTPSGFKWSYEESVPAPNQSKKVAGTDYGRVEPYTTVVMNENGVEAVYVASGRLTQANLRRENILKHKKHNQQKISHYNKLDPDGQNPMLVRKAQTLITENKRLANKALRLGQTIANQTGSELAQKLKKHNIHLHVTENLKWATGAKYGSRFIHSRLKEATTHSLKRQGVMAREVSARNNSQHCINCAAQITHNSKNRTTYCQSCSITLKRDYLAALNMIKKTSQFPATLRINGAKHRVQTQFSATTQQTSNRKSIPTNTT